MNATMTPCSPRFNRRWRRNLLPGTLPMGIAIWGLFTMGLIVALTVAPRLAPAAEVNVYSYRQPFLIKPLFDAFTAETGIRVKVVFSQKGITERIRREGRNSPADLLFTVDIGRLHDAVTAGILQPVDTPVLRANVPAPYRQPEGLWYGLTVRARVVLASKARVPRGALRTYEDLTGEKWRGRICTRSSQHVYNVAMLASMIANHGERAAQDWAAGVLENLARKPQGNDRAQVRAIKEGECDLALVNHYYLGVMMEKPEQRPWAEAVYPIFPNQEGRGTHVNISGAAVTRHAPHKAEAIRLLEYLTEEKAQALYAGQNFEYPVNPRVELAPLLKSWGPFKADPLNLAKVAEQRSLAIRIFDRVGFP